MLRITTMRTNRTDPAQLLPALEAAREAAEAASKVTGVRSVRVYLGDNGIVFAGEADNYASADRILTDGACQRAFGRLVVEFGLNISRDEFLLDPPQVYPFLKK